MVLAKESHQRFFLSWRGRCLLVSTANIRVASQLEGGDHLQRLKESEELEDNWQRGTKHYEDMSGAPEPIEEGEPQEALGWEAHDGVLAPKPGGRPKNRAKEIAKTLKGMKTIKTIQKQRRKKEDRLDLRTASASKGREEEKKKETREEDQTIQRDDEEHQNKMQQIRDQMNQWLGQPQDEGFQGRLRQHLLDDVPQQFKKRSHEEEPGTMTEEQLVKRFRPSFFSYIMVASVRSQKESKSMGHQRRNPEVEDFTRSPNHQCPISLRGKETASRSQAPERQGPIYSDDGRKGRYCAGDTRNGRRSQGPPEEESPLFMAGDESFCQPAQEDNSKRRTRSLCGTSQWTPSGLGD